MGTAIILFLTAAGLGVAIAAANGMLAQKEAKEAKEPPPLEDLCSCDECGNLLEECDCVCDGCDELIFDCACEEEEEEEEEVEELPKTEFKTRPEPSESTCDINYGNLQFTHHKETESHLDKFIQMPQPDDRITIRLLPPAIDKSFFVATRHHRVDGKNENCLKEQKNGRWQGDCPICDYYSWLWKESEHKSDDRTEQRELQNKAREIKPVERYYYNAVDRTRPDDGPKVLSVGKSLHKKILEGIVGDPMNETEPLGDVSSINDGYDFRIYKEVRGAWPSYEKSDYAHSSSPLGEKEEVKRWAPLLHDLDKFKESKSKEELTEVLKIHLKILEENVETEALSGRQRLNRQIRKFLEEQRDSLERLSQSQDKSVALEEETRPGITMKSASGNTIELTEVDEDFKKKIKQQTNEAVPIADEDFLDQLRKL